MNCVTIVAAPWTTLEIRDDRVEPAHVPGCCKMFKPHSHCADVATVHPDAGQPVYRDAPGHIS